MLIVKRVFTIILGILVMITGVMLVPVPGPGGGVVVLAGLGILATELASARWVLNKFNALRVKYFDSQSPRNKKIIIAGGVVCSIIGMVGGWFFVNKFLRE